MRSKIGKQMVENVIVDLSHWRQDVDFKLAKEDGILALKDRKNDLLDKLFANWQSKQRQLLYIFVSSEYLTYILSLKVFFIIS
ncbi:hypothetical protein [Wolbachia endosymbiont of Tribolium confusum]|uniref:hypothetical protein n=1 Tax=Wolbachia endosymbiont of Tribolium confusum TaxID=214474 RepID=UPI001CF4F118|nr:hypothetical protein [Wolbachia endosymbiont of Tribolium confusum]MCA7009976.1 hypothetical protein [Wolbachia endosymbiont of Tribolium confusum]